jgi:DUF1016 N-terminal domain
MTKKKSLKVQSSTIRLPGQGESSHQILHTVCGEFYESIAEVLRAAHINAYRAVNFVMVEAYWNIGRMIVEEEQNGKERAEYGAALIKNLSVRLRDEFGKGFTESNLWNIRQFYLVFPSQDAQSQKLYALRRELTWTHYRLLMRIENTDARRWYMTEAANQNRSVRAIQRQINSLLRTSADDWRTIQPAFREAP